MMEGEIEARDRISELPADIIYEIMGYLSTKEVFQTSVLSKTWCRLQQSYPVLYFSQDEIMEAYGHSSSTIFPLSIYRNSWAPLRRFTEYVHRSLFRSPQLMVRPQELHIYLTYFNFKLSHRLRRWIKLAIKLGVKELDLGVCGLFTDPPTFPECSSETLTVLKLRGFALEQPLVRIGTTKFKSLRNLALTMCRINGPAVLKLTGDLYFLEDLMIDLCSGFNSILVSKLPRLKNLEVYSPDKDDWSYNLIDITMVKSLRRFSFFGKKNHCAINMFDCPELKILRLHCVEITEKELHCILAQLPMLENLHTTIRTSLKTLRIFGRRLKTVIFCAYTCPELEVIKLATPSLSNFIFACKDWKPNCLISIAGGHVLKNFLLHGTVITDKEFCDFISKCPLLEHLWVSGCRELQRVKISCERLKRLHILGGVNLEVIEVDTPNLSSFSVTGSKITRSSIVGCDQLDIRFEEKCRNKNSFWAGELEKMLDFFFQVDDDEVVEFLIRAAEDDMYPT